jgi:hypothetical protein
LSGFLFHENLYVQVANVEEIMRIKGRSGLKYVEHLKNIAEIKNVIEEFEELFEDTVIT